MELLLHAGAGKTGSTAIQGFLSRSYDDLIKKGICYPSPNDPLSITAGNAERIWYFLVQDRENHAEQFIRQQVEAANTYGCDRVILSSELLVELDSVHLDKLKNIFRNFFSIVTPLIYARNPADWAYSAWMQHIKRSAIAEPFETYYKKIARAHIPNILRFATCFENSKIVSYDANKAYLIESFLEFSCIAFQDLDLSSCQTSVNRSLTIKEIELMSDINRIFANPSLSERISDFLVSTYPDRVPSVCTDKNICQHILKLNEPELHELNLNFATHGSLILKK